MNFDSKSSIGFDDAVKAADKILTEKNPKVKRITRLMISSQIRPYVIFCYYYLRWVDDFIDNNINPLDKKKIFFSNQTSLINSIAKSENFELNNPEEYFLLYFMKFALAQNTRLLIDSFILMMKTIGDDIKRLEKKGIFPDKEKQKYMDDNTKSLFNIVVFFVQPKSASRFQNKYNCIKTLVHILFIKDLAEDFSSGYINISSEEIERYHLNSNNLPEDPKLAVWYKDTFAQFNKVLKKDAALVRKLSLKLKLFWFWLFPYCIHKMNRLKIYDYNPNIYLNRNLVKEARIYSLTILAAIKYFYIIFMHFELPASSNR